MPAHELFSIFCLEKKIGVSGENLPKVALRLRSHLLPSVWTQHYLVQSSGIKCEHSLKKAAKRREYQGSLLWERYCNRDTNTLDSVKQQAVYHGLV